MMMDPCSETILMQRRYREAHVYRDFRRSISAKTTDKSIMGKCLSPHSHSSPRMNPTFVFNNEPSSPMEAERGPILNPNILNQKFHGPQKEDKIQEDVEPVVELHQKTTDRMTQTEEFKNIQKQDPVKDLEHVIQSMSSLDQIHSLTQLLAKRQHDLTCKTPAPVKEPELVHVPFHPKPRPTKVISKPHNPKTPNEHEERMLRMSLTPLSFFEDRVVGMDFITSTRDDDCESPSYEEICYHHEYLRQAGVV